MCATALALGYAIGRIGCQVSGDGDYGIRSSLPWAMGYPHGTVPDAAGRAACSRRRSTRRSACACWPTCCGTCATACARAWCSRCTCCCSGLERFLVEFIRRNKEVFAGLTAPQLESIVAVRDRRRCGWW